MTKWIPQVPSAQAPRGYRGLFAQNILKTWCPEMPFLVFWEYNLVFEMFAKSIVIIMLIFNGNFLRQVLDCIIYFSFY